MRAKQKLFFESPIQIHENFAQIKPQNLSSHTNATVLIGSQHLVRICKEQGQYQNVPQWL